MKATISYKFNKFLLNLFQGFSAGCYFCLLVLRIFVNCCCCLLVPLSGVRRGVRGEISPSERKKKEKGRKIREKGKKERKRRKKERKQEKGMRKREKGRKNRIKYQKTVKI